MTAPLLEVRGITVDFPVHGGEVHAVRGVDLTVHSGEVVGVVGESGCGKSATMLAVLGLLDAGVRVGGSVRFRGQELLGHKRALRSLRGGRVSMIFQDPMTSLNPVLTVGRQIAEAIAVHQRLPRSAAYRKAVELLDLVAIPDAARRMRSYPHELSGGMRQRVMIAMAIANDPDLLIADEPTTALDVTVQAQILQTLADVRAERDLAIVLITHDLGVVAGIADSVHVMYAGRMVEEGSVAGVFYRPNHPYTVGLLRCLPRLDRRDAELAPIGGMPPSLRGRLAGCAFAPRCPHAEDRCTTEDPQLRAVDSTTVACHLAPIKLVRR